MGQFLDSDIWVSFRHAEAHHGGPSRHLLFFIMALVAGTVDVGSMSIRGSALNNRLPPIWNAEGRASPSRVRQVGPGHPVGHPVRPEDLAPRRVPGRGLFGGARHRPRACRGLFRRHGRLPDHADRRRAAHLPGDPDRLLVDRVAKPCWARTWTRRQCSRSWSSRSA